MTLYTHAGDTATSSTCIGGCAATWPPLETNGQPTARAGVTGQLSTLTRPDGTTQVTYRGLPLYYWQGDTKAGDVTGNGVEGFSVGDRVVINPGLEHGATITVVGEHTDGTHCELIALPAEQVHHLDDALTFEEAAAFPLVYETAYRMLVTRARIQPGETVLIWGIGGGVATAAFEVARALGARAVVTSGSDEKLEQARAWGAELTVNHADGDVVAAVKEAGGVDVVVETVGEATWARSLAAVKPRGRVVVCGATSGPNPPAQLHRFWWKQLDVLGSTMGTATDFLGAYDLIRSGRARVHVDRVYPLAEIRAAHERLEAGEQLGKIVLSIP